MSLNIAKYSSEYFLLKGGCLLWPIYNRSVTLSSWNRLKSPVT